MRYNNLVENIREILEASDTSLEAVYEGVPNVIEKYPCCIILPAGHENKLRTIGGANERVYTIKLVLCNNLDGDEVERQKGLRDVVDDVINVIEQQSNLTISDEAEWSNPTRADYTFESEPANIYKCVVTFQVTTIHSRT